MENQPSMGDQFLTMINRIIEDNIDNENFTVEDLAHEVALSRSMLHRKLKKLTGKSASDHITKIRLTRAKELLENDVATASEVAYRVGFNSPSYFNKVFKKHFEVSPGSIKKNIAYNKSQLLAEEHQGEKKIFFSKIRIRNIITIAIVLLAIFIFGGILTKTKQSRPAERSIAVLPLCNLTGKVENDYFVDGMHDAIIGELGRIGSVRVISRTSTLRYHDSDMLLKDIANELGVNNIIEGSVYAAEDSLRIILQLIEVFPEEKHLMVHEYNDAIENALKIHSAVVKDITKEIKVELTSKEEEYLSHSRTVNPETYKTYLRGMHYAMQGTNESLIKGIELFENAIANDPTDPLSYAGLALNYAMSGHFHHESDESFKRAFACANKALEIDSTIAEAHTALSVLNELTTWDWKASKQGFENALAYNPNDDIAHAYYAYYYLLFNEEDLCLYHAEKSVELAPLSSTYNCWLAYLYHFYGYHEKAEYRAKRSLELMEGNPYGNLILGWIQIHKGEYKKALEFHEKLPLAFDYWKIWISYSYIIAGQKDKALGVWNEFQNNHSQNKYVDPFCEGMVASYLGYNDKAFELINVGIDRKIFPANFIIMFPLTEEFRTDKRYLEIIRRLNLPTDKTLYCLEY